MHIHTVLGSNVHNVHILHFPICVCSVQLSKCCMEMCHRNKIIISSPSSSLTVVVFITSIISSSSVYHYHH